MQSRHQEFVLQLDNTKIQVSSNFDSANLEYAQFSKGKIVLTPAYDPVNPQYSLRQSSKTFFHFKMSSEQAITVFVVIERMKILEYFVSDEQFDELYRVCMARKPKKSYNPQLPYIKTKMPSMRRVQSENNYELHFQVQLIPEQEIYLAYHYPYSLQQSQLLQQRIEGRVNDLNSLHGNIFYCNQLLIESLQGRPVNLMTLTAQDDSKIEEQESRISKSLFPYFQIEGRPKKFSKPYILLTARVHSGETSSSYALQGIIDFLLSNDPRSAILLKSFVFLIIPILNPDGVFHGTYRMDTQGHNLNRFYNTAQSHKQPSIFAVQTIANYYGNRIVFFMDLHSHPHPNKGSFIYGNCHQSLQQQTETQLFAKLLSYYSQCFGYEWSNFSTSQMSSRDANQLLTKDGSARVQLYKILNIPFAFTMQIGYHGCALKNREENHLFSGDYQRGQKVFTTRDYQQHGKSIMLTLLKMFSLNSSRASSNEEVKCLQQIRQQICRELVEKEERFRQMDSFIYKKIKIISELSYQQHYLPFFKKYPFAEHVMKTSLAHHQNGSRAHMVSQQSMDKKRALSQKRQLSLKLSNKFQSIDISPQKYKQIALKSFKSTVQPKKQSQFISTQKNRSKQQYSIKFARQLNLNFNPFPETERKKIYQLVGNKRSTLKKNLMNELQINNQEAFDIETIDVHSQLQKAEIFFQKQQTDAFRSVKIGSFSPHPLINEEETNSIQEHTEKNYQTEGFILPKINRPQHIERQFNLEARLAKQYQKQYNIRDKSQSPVPVKSTLRANNIRMRNLIKSIK